MAYPIKDCDCEDFPCCEHADNFPDPLVYKKIMDDIRANDGS